MTQKTDQYLYYVGISTFAGYPNTRDLKNVDIAVMGIPFDVGVTNRPGARFGPRAVRNISNTVFGFNYLWSDEFSLDEACPTIIDYGDVGQHYGPDAIKVMVDESYQHAKKIIDTDAKLLTIGGDHTIPYGLIRAASEKYGQLALLHFDSHQDSIPSNGAYSHASFAYDLAQEGCINVSKSAQICIRTNFENCGYTIFYANQVIEMGPKALAAKLKSIVEGMPVYITFDIDALDPAYAPGTGTPVCGGPSTNDLRTTLRNLAGINVVAADIVEISPTYDHAEITALAGATIAQDLMCLMGYAK